MRVKLSNELTDGLFSPRKNNRINLLDKQLQESGWTSAVSEEEDTLLGNFRAKKHFAQISKKQKKRSKKRRNKKNKITRVFKNSKEWSGIHV